MLEAAWPGLFVTGNYFAGVSTTACIAQAQQTAGRVLHHLAGQFLPARCAVA
jgi:protoporphyrinogen oxidase